MSANVKSILLGLAIIVLAIILLFVTRSCNQNDCESKGGTLKPIYGTNGSYICVDPEGRIL